MRKHGHLYARLYSEVRTVFKEYYQSALYSVIGIIPWCIVPLYQHNKSISTNEIYPLYILTPLHPELGDLVAPSPIYMLFHSLTHSFTNSPTHSLTP